MTDVIAAQIINWAMWQAVITAILGASASVALIWAMLRVSVAKAEWEKDAGRVCDEYDLPLVFTFCGSLVAIAITIFGGVYPLAKVLSAPQIVLQEFKAQKP